MQDCSNTVNPFEPDNLRGMVLAVETTASTSQYPVVLTAAMAAELLQVHVEHLRRMVREGQIPCHRFPGGREMRFLRDELLAWLAALPGDDQSSTARTHQIDASGT
jgi:excisionase family DNA binding protein